MAVSRNNRFTEPVLRAVTTSLSGHVRCGASLVVGYSGGLDSTVLLHAVHQVSLDGGYRVSARHIHHGLSTHADSWAESCVRQCRDLGVQLDVVRVRVPLQAGEGPEAAARRVRHAALANHPAEWIVLGHHADDQAETLLHNLLRGTGLRGAAAMPELHGRLLRPLLGLQRRELLAYAQARHLAWIEDESNADQRYARNFLRRKVMPIVAERYPNVASQFAAAARRFGEAESLLDQLAMLDLGERPPRFPIPLHLIRELTDERARNLLRAMLGWQKVQSPDERRLKEFVRQLRTAGKDRHPRLDLSPYSLKCEGGSLHLVMAD